MQFPARDLTNQYISKSYQDVLQQYPQPSYLYVLDGYGNVVFAIPSASIGSVIITSDVTASMTVATASYAQTSSFLEYSDAAESASWASHSLSASYAESAAIAGAAFYADIADTASIALSASVSETSSYLKGSGTIFGGIQFDTASSVSSQREGYIFWDNENHTLAIKPDITASTLQVGQETWLRYIAGEDIGNGDAIYITSTPDPDGHPVCKRAIADGTRTKFGVVAIATNTVSSGSHNVATIVGVVNDLDTSMYPAGTPLFLSETTPGGYRFGVPSEPYERVLLGYCTRQDATAGRVYVGIIGIPDAFRAFAGVTLLPSITNNGDGTVTIGTGSAALNTMPSGKGTTRNWNINSASFAVPLGLTDVSYIIADYNNGSPIWALASSSAQIDDIQKVQVYTVTRAVTNSVAWAAWDEPGNLLANKLMDRIVEVNGIERTEGMLIGESGSRYVTVTEGAYWLGVSKNTSSYYNSTSSALILLYHSGSGAYTSSLISQYINTQYDDGTGLAPLTANRYVVNYVYKSAMNQNRCMIMLSDAYVRLVDAQSSQPPAVPGDLLEGGILVGRAIYQNTLPTATQIDSAFVIQFTPSAIMYHNDLIGLQGGTTDEYYHLTAAEYATLQSGTASYAISASQALSASYVDVSAIQNFFVPMEFTYKSSVTPSDPGNGNFQYDSATTSSISSIYISDSTANGVDVSRILTALTSGSFNIYVQQKDDSTRSSLFEVNGSVTDSGSWLSIPVAHITSSIAGLPANNKNCAFLLFNRGSSLVVGGTYQITASVSVTSSYADTAATASYFSGSISNAVWADTASWAITASHALVAERLTNSGLSIPKYDYSYVEYTGPMTQVSTCSYRVGGASGSLVARVVALYSGNTFTGVTSSIF